MQQHENNRNQIEQHFSSSVVDQPTVDSCLGDSTPCVHHFLSRSFHAIDPHYRGDLLKSRQQVYSEPFLTKQMSYRLRYGAGNWGNLLQFSHYNPGDTHFFLACSDAQKFNRVLKFENGCTRADPIARPSLSQHFLVQHDDVVEQIQWSLDNRFIYDTSRDRTVCKMSVETGKFCSIVNTRKFGLPVGLCVPRNDKASSLVYFCTDRNGVVCWDSRLSGKQSHNLDQVNQQVEKFQNMCWIDCYMTNNDQIIVSGSKNGILTWWDIRMKKELYSVMDSNRKLISSVEIDQNDRNVLIFSASGDVYSFDQHLLVPDSNNMQTLQSITGLKTYKGAQNTFDRKSAHFSNGSNYVIAGSDTGAVFIWNAHTCEELFQINCGRDADNEPYRVLSALFAPIPCESDILAITCNLPALLMYQLCPKQNTNLSWQELYFDDDIGQAEDDISDDDFEEAEDWADNPITEDSSAECTYELSYADQIVYLCLTCLANGVHPAGLCEPCAKFCHRMRGHHVYNLGRKRNFKCDCGNSKFNGYECCLLPNKDPTNPRNKYNHNFKNEWCYCGAEEIRPMYQCDNCEDWFHGRCLNVDVIDEELSYICDICLSGVCSFLREYPIDSTPSTESSAISKRTPLSGVSVARGRFLPLDWRDKITTEHRDQMLNSERAKEPVNVLVPRRKAPVVNISAASASLPTEPSSSSSRTGPDSVRPVISKPTQREDEEEEILDESGDEDNEDDDDVDSESDEFLEDEAME